MNTISETTFSFLRKFHRLTRLSVVIQKKLQATEHALLDLEERHRQANATIKEKEYLISNLLKSGRWHLLPTINFVKYHSYFVMVFNFHFWIFSWQLLFVK